MSHGRIGITRRLSDTCASGLPRLLNQHQSAITHHMNRETKSKQTDPRWASLIASWPDYFPSRKRTRRVTPIETWGVQCDLGWSDLLHRLLKELDAVALRLNEPLPQILQIKEKFGCLRVSVAAKRGHAIHPDIAKIIERFCTESQSICESCGSPGRLFKGSYWATRCNAHQPEL